MSTQHKMKDIFHNALIIFGYQVREFDLEYFLIPIF